MFEFAQLQINQQKAFELEVVKHQINVEVFIVEANPLLPLDKGKAFTQFQQKLLHIANNGLFKLAFLVGFVL